MRVYSYLRNRVRARRIERLYAEFVASGDLVFDVGANVGGRVSVFRALGARVVAVEPQSSCIEKLRAEWGDDQQVYIEPVAVAAREGTADLHLADVSTISTLDTSWIDTTSTGRFSDHRWNGIEVVQTTTLDRLIETHGVPAFCKIDVEGFELEAIRGLAQPLAAISFEYTREFDHRVTDCVRHLDDLGMTLFNYSSGESARLRGYHRLHRRRSGPWRRALGDRLSRRHQRLRRLLYQRRGRGL